MVTYGRFDCIIKHNCARFQRNKIYWGKRMWTWLLPTDLKQLQNSASVNASFPLEHVLKNCFMQGSASYRSASSVSSTKPSALWSNNCLNTVRIGSRQPCFFEPETTKYSCNKFRLLPSQSRLQNSWFFLKISKEIGKAWRKSLTRTNRLVPHLLFDYSRVLEYTKIRTVLQYNPNLARILPILPENLESRSICNQDRKKSQFWHLIFSNEFLWYCLIHPTEYQEYTCWKWYPENLKNLHKI